MSSKYYVFAAWQEFDKEAKAHIIKASTPFSAAVAYAIREWGLYHAAEARYDVYDSAGNSGGTHVIPDWVDDSLGEALKEAFHLEVLVERNESGGQGLTAGDCSGGCSCHSSGQNASAYKIPPASSAAPIDWATAKCKGCGGTSNVYLRMQSGDGEMLDFDLAEEPQLVNGNIHVGDLVVTPKEISDLVAALPTSDFTVLCDCRGRCEDETSLELLRTDGTVEDGDDHFAVEYLEKLSALAGLPFTRPSAVGGFAFEDASQQEAVAEEDPSALTADHIEFAAYSDGSVVLQGVGYFDFYGGLDDDTTPAIDRGFRERHGLRCPKGNKLETCYMQADQAIEALKADGAVHDQDLQAFIDA